jgi:uncharacterized metal-binding protein YceD (DUF177 family)
MEFKGKVSFRELDRQDVEVNGTESDTWVQNWLESSAPQVISVLDLSSKEWAKKSQMQVSVAASKMGSDYVVRGRFSGQVLAPCSRCGDPFKASRNPAQEFNVIVRRLARGQAESDADLDSGDPDYLITEADEIDIIGILREQLIVLEPLAECPNFDKSGKCSHCGVTPKTEASTDSSHFKVAMGQIFQKIRQ